MKKSNFNVCYLYTLMLRLHYLGLHNNLILILITYQKDGLM